MPFRTFITITLTWITVACANDKERTSALLSAGDLAMKSYDIDNARKAYSKALTIDPCLSPALDKLGKTSMTIKRPNEALDFYNRAIECQPDSVVYYLHRASVFYELDQFNKAMTDIKFVLKQKPETADAYHLEGLIATKIHDLNSALSFSSKAISLNPKNEQFFVARASVNYFLKNLAEAEMDLTSAERLNRNEPEIYNLRALIDVNNGLFEHAMTQIKIALELSPDNPVYLNTRGFILLSQNRLLEALKDISISIDIDPSNAYAYRNRGIYHYLTGNFESAIWDLHRASTLEKYVEKVHFYRGMSYLKSGRTLLACEEFKLSEKEADKMLTVDLLKPCRNKRI